jgi:hypothetical protein
LVPTQKLQPANLQPTHSTTKAKLQTGTILYTTKTIISILKHILKNVERDAHSAELIQPVMYTKMLNELSKSSEIKNPSVSMQVLCLLFELFACPSEAK